MCIAVWMHHHILLAVLGNLSVAWEVFVGVQRFLLLKILISNWYVIDIDKEIVSNVTFFCEGGFPIFITSISSGLLKTLSSQAPADVKDIILLFSLRPTHYLIGHILFKEASMKVCQDALDLVSPG